MTDIAPTPDRATEPEPVASRPRPERTMWILLGIVALIVAVAVIVVVVRPSAPPPDPESPEGVVYSYLEAVLDGDTAAAAALLAPSATGDNCPRGPVESFTGGVSISSTEVRGDRADVSVTITQSSTRGSFGSSSWEYTDSFTLEKVGGDWRISWVPWTFMVCEPGDRS